MPKSLEAIEKAADLLEQACKDMKRDPYSKGGRDRLIAGSRGILQGTTAMLVIFDESQVKISFKEFSICNVDKVMVKTGLLDCPSGGILMGSMYVFVLLYLDRK